MQAVVIGGSMAGLLAARVLSDHFQTVTIIERDPLPDSPQQRRGVPQGRHTHGLLASGSGIIEQLFPGIWGTLVSDGAVDGDVVASSRWFFEGGFLARPASTDLRGLLMSRPMLEDAVRRRVLALPNVQRMENAAVEALTVDDRKQRVTGVRVGKESLIADLVVDATGRGSRSPRWLEEIGFPKPAEEQVQVSICYTTRVFRRRENDLDGDLAVIIPSTPVSKCGGVMLAQEGNRWTVTIFTHFGSPVPEDLDQFREAARCLPSTLLYDVIRDAEPIGDAAATRFPASVRKRYERLDRFPAGYLVFGDAICSFNPIYGQGMSVAALEAVELKKTLESNAPDLARAFFRRAAKVIDNPWSIAAGSDLRIPETVGPRTGAVKFINWYLAKLHKAAHTDPVAAVAFLRVANLLAPPPSLMSPAIASRVLLASLRPSKSTPEKMRAAAAG